MNRRASISTYVMQTFLNAITRYVRDKFTNPCTWGHLDDLMVAHHDATYLPLIHILHIFSELHYLFKLINDLWRHTCAYFVSTLVHFTFRVNDEDIDIEAD